MRGRFLTETTPALLTLHADHYSHANGHHDSESIKMDTTFDLNRHIVVWFDLA